MAKSSGKSDRKQRELPTPKTSNVDYDRELDRENRDPREPPAPYVTNAEIEAREMEQRKRKGRPSR